ncbi:50S ribosomal protein L16, partial [Limnobacter sp. MED105]
IKVWVYKGDTLVAEMLRRHQLRQKKKSVVRVVLLLVQPEQVHARRVNPKVLAQQLVVQTKRKALPALPQNSNLGAHDVTAITSQI